MARSKGSPDGVLEGKVPGTSPGGIPGVVIQGAEELGDLLKGVGGKGGPVGKQRQKLGALIGEHPNSERAGVKQPANHTAFVVIGRLKFVEAEGSRDPRISRGPEDSEKRGNAGLDGAREELSHIRIHVVINMHVILRGEAIAIGVQDARVE